MKTESTSSAADRARHSARGPSARQGAWSHVSIDTAELERSLTFYRALFDAEPVVLEHDYARFTPREPGLVLALNAVPRSLPGTGALQHLGILYPDQAGLARVRERMARAGFAVTGKTDTQCCYARLDQFWATDPSGVRWELFLAHAEIVAAETRAGSEVPCCAPGCCS